MEAIAKTVLSDDEKLSFDALLAICAAIGKQRKDLAHGVFGISTEIPDGVLWTEIGTHANYIVRDIDRFIKTGGWMSEEDNNLRKSIFIYKTSDLNQLRSEIDQLHQFLFTFHKYLVDPVASAAEYRQLCSEPRMAKELERLRDAQMRTQKPPL